MAEEEPMSAAEVTNVMAEAIARAGVHPAHVFAVRRCGFILTEENADTFDEEDIQAWESAIDAYFELHPDAEPL